MKILNPGSSLGRYKISSVIGFGGQGVVYMAKDKCLDRIVALKTMRMLEHEASTNDRLYCRRFIREAKILAELDHPHIVKIFDCGEANQIAYLATEYIEGPAIDEWADREHLSINEWLRLAVQILDALQYAHERGVVHRDIKPSNVLVGGANSSPRVKLIDWGVAFSHRWPRLTEEGMQVGTLGASMDPAFFLNAQRAPSAQSDLYGVGTLLYRLLCGALPWKTPTDGDMGDDEINACLEMQITPPSYLRPGIPEALDALILSLMHIDPARRPRSAAEARASLETVMRTTEAFADMATHHPKERALTVVPLRADTRTSFARLIEYKRTTRRMSSRLLHCGHYQVVLGIHTAEAPRDQEFEEFVECAFESQARAQSDLNLCRGLIVTDGGVPSARQRMIIKEILADGSVRTAVVSDSLLIRGIVVGLSWANPAIKWFSTSHLDRAMDYLGLRSYAPAIHDALVEMQKELKTDIRGLELTLSRLEQSLMN